MATSWIKEPLLRLAAFYIDKRGSTNLKNPSPWFREWVLNLSDGGSNATSGETVNQKTAMGFAAYFACIRVISEDCACLPIDVYEVKGNERKSTGELDPVNQLLNVTAAPDDDMSAMAFRETIFSHALAYSGGYAEIVRDGALNPVGLYPLDPTKVSIKRNTESRQVVYLIRNDTGPDVPLRPDQVFHIHGLGFDGLTGHVLSQLSQQMLGAALAAQKFGGAFFGNGAHSGGVLEVPKQLSDEALKRLGDSFKARHQGAGQAFSPMILEEDMKWKTTTVNAKDSQMIEGMNFYVEEVCRLFRVNPNKIQHWVRSTFANTVAADISHVGDTLIPWEVRFEQEVKRKLLTGRPRVFCKHNNYARLRGDIAQQSTFFREQWNIGAKTQNDIRGLMDENPVDGGDEAWVPSQMMPLTLAIKFWEKKIELLDKPAPAPAIPPPSDGTDPNSPEPPPDDNNRELIAKMRAAHLPLVASTLTRIDAVRTGKVQRAKTPESRDECLQSHLGVAKAAIGEALGAFFRAMWAVLGHGTPTATANTDYDTLLARVVEEYAGTASAFDVDPFSESLLDRCAAVVVQHTGGTL